MKVVNTYSGLSDDNVRAVYLHKNGLLYIGTSVGLSVFDGHNVININTAIKQEVKNIIPLGDDSLILIRDNAITIFNLENYGFREKNYNALYSNKFIYGVLGGGYIYCASNDGLIRINLQNLNYNNISAGTESYPKEIVYTQGKCIGYSSFSRRIYILHKNGLLIWDILKKDIINPEVASLTIHSEAYFLRDVHCQDGKVIFKNGPGKIFVFSEESRELKHLDLHAATLNVDKQQIISYSNGKIFLADIISGQKDSIDLQDHFNVRQVLSTEHDEYLLATTEGLVVAKKPAVMVKSKIQDELKNEKKYIELQRKISFGKSFFFNRRSGISEFDSTNGQIYYYKKPQYISEEILNIFPYKYGKIIVTSFKGYYGFDLINKKYFKLHIFTNKTDSILSNIRIITGNYDSVTNHLILCPYLHPVVVKDFTSNSEVFWNGYDYNWFRTVRSVHYVGNYEYYFGANGNDGLIRINLKSGKGQYYPAAEFSNAGNNSAIINQILPFGRFYFLATADGLIRFEPQSGKLSAVLLDGIPFHDQIYGLEVINNVLYASSRNALCFLSESGDLTRLNTYDNFAGAGIPFAANDKVRLFVNNTLISIDIPKQNQNHSNTYISHIGFNNSWTFVGTKDEITMNYGSGSVQVLFGTAIFNHSVSKMLIKYRFSGSKSWQLLNGTSFQTGNLDYGDHQIEYFSTHWGKSSRISSFTIHVLRPWWASYQFYALCLMFSIGLAIVFFKWKLKQKTTIERKKLNLILSTSEGERSRISRDFHDGVGTKLSSLKLIVEGSKSNSNSELLAELPNIVDEILVDVRSIISELSPQSLKQYGLFFALSSLINTLSAQIPSFKFELEMEENFPRLDDFTEINVYRVCQELINNAIKHSYGNKVTISIRQDQKRLHIKVTDNGIGISSDNNSNGFGDSNVRLRVNSLNGNISISPSVPKGTEIKIVLPLKT